MPAKNSVKIYLENGYYHIYNRGTGKNEIFIDPEDYKVFLHYLEKYLDPSSQHSMAKEVKLLAFCLMPNHFHLFVLQLSRNGITKLMRAVSTCYAMFFNKKYEKSGTIFQGIYKAALIESDPQFLHISRYIHLNPRSFIKDWENYPYSSYKFYVGEHKVSWLETTFVLNFFNDKNNADRIGHSSYRSFVEDYALDSKGELADLTID
ncbi:hypothetical protein A2870_01610 [Candidatus Curtissbacteria bacterium RIFCSPHIGHO2_01_FULL_41_11]|uniref:Transposase IS200-like domain-containing protein n=1 Tax=Candidatus Curtissbacteria bacterium RIFCSPHIGHO2_01_FULL_41_11 TaxID=1797711 RepID=A0A1F5G4W8_9BACT|nr:MAG: hypothetical protein A2870_01610 [Candidatus Curtissbacteria bacterium RIFCSPHIGHO2_01_FULL_41_11]